MVLKNKTEDRIIYEKDWFGQPTNQELKSLKLQNKIAELDPGKPIEFEIQPKNEVKWDWNNDDSIEDVGNKTSWTFQDTGYIELRISKVNGLSRIYAFYAIAKLEPEIDTDTDGDGVPDNKDDCPKVPGPRENNGCPIKDRDLDGVLDNKDECPNYFGLKEFSGCPDTDGDGVPDNKDECPKESGPRENNGCPDNGGNGLPDADDDGISDSLDGCPKVWGPKENNGCPIEDRDSDGVLGNKDKCPDDPGPAKYEGCPDTDKDGVPDNNDECPKEPGPKENNGCPKDDEICQVTKAGYRAESTKVGWKYDKCKNSEFHSVRSAKIKFDVHQCMQINKMIMEGQKVCDVTLALYENGKEIMTFEKQLLKGKTNWGVSSLPILKANSKYEFRFTSDSDCIIVRKNCGSFYPDNNLIKFYEESDIVGFDFEIEY